MPSSLCFLVLLIAASACVYIGDIDRICWNSTNFETERRCLLVKRKVLDGGIIVVNAYRNMYRDRRDPPKESTYKRPRSRSVSVIFKAQKDGKLQRMKIIYLGYPDDMELYYFKAQDGTAFLFTCPGAQLYNFVYILEQYGYELFRCGVNVINRWTWEVKTPATSSWTVMMQADNPSEKHTAMQDALCEVEKNSEVSSLMAASSRLWGFVVILLLFFGIVNLVSRNFKVVFVEGDSMNPTYQDGTVLVGSIVRNEHDLEDKNYPCCVVRLGDDAFVIKRLIGVPGDTVELIGGATVVNGNVVMSPSTTNKDNAVYTLGEDDYLLLGDNRANSYDGRYWPGNFVSLEDICFVILGSELKEVAG